MLVEMIEQLVSNLLSLFENFFWYNFDLVWVLRKLQPGPRLLSLPSDSHHSTPFCLCRYSLTRIITGSSLLLLRESTLSQLRLFVDVLVWPSSTSQTEDKVSCSTSSPIKLEEFRQIKQPKNSERILTLFVVVVWSHCSENSQSW